MSLSFRSISHARTIFPSTVSCVFPVFLLLLKDHIDNGCDDLIFKFVKVHVPINSTDVAIVKRVFDVPISIQEEL